MRASASAWSHFGFELTAHPQCLGDREALVQRTLLGQETNPGKYEGGVVPRRPAEDLRVARIRCQEANGKLKKGGLAGSVGADQSYDPAGGDGDAEISDRPS